MKIGIVGAGAIANFLLQEINQNEMDHMKVTSILVRNRVKYAGMEHRYDVQLFDELDTFLESDVDIVVEAANVEAVQQLFPKIITKKDIVLISIGALADVDFLREMNDLAEMHKRTIHLPSGAVGGLDLLQNAHALGGVTEISLITKKPAQTLIDGTVMEATTVFEGKATEAIKQFPKNINVSIILSLAGIGVVETNVTIIADPTIDNNIHTINVKGDFGEASLSVTNNPLEENPKTSMLAAMSILGVLKRNTNHIKIGG